jgi:hypothetical protein
MIIQRIQPHIIFLAVVFCLWLLISPQTVVLQTNCQPPSLGSNYAWPKGAQVQVNKVRDARGRQVGRWAWDVFFNSLE